LDFQVFSLVSKGYGTLAQVRALDTAEFLDALEFEKIKNDIESFVIEEARNGGS
jgi:hypothetical protein